MLDRVWTLLAEFGSALAIFLFIFATAVVIMRWLGVLP